MNREQARGAVIQAQGVAGVGLVVASVSLLTSWVWGMLAFGVSLIVGAFATTWQRVER